MGRYVLSLVLGLGVEMFAYFCFKKKNSNKQAKNLMRITTTCQKAAWRGKLKLEWEASTFPYHKKLLNCLCYTASMHKWNISSIAKLIQCRNTEIFVNNCWNRNVLVKGRGKEIIIKMKPVRESQADVIKQ